jgi:hypothetical protein
VSYFNLKQYDKAIILINTKEKKDGIMNFYQLGYAHYKQKTLKVPSLNSIKLLMAKTS